MPEQEIDFFVSIANSVKANEFSLADNTLEHLLGRKRLELNEYFSD